MATETGQELLPSPVSESVWLQGAIGWVVSGSSDLLMQLFPISGGGCERIIHERHSVTQSAATAPRQVNQTNGLPVKLLLGRHQETVQPDK